MVIAPLNSAGESFIDVQPEWSARVMADAAFMTAGVTRGVRCEVNEWELFLKLVAAGVLALACLAAYLLATKLLSGVHSVAQRR